MRFSFALRDITCHSVLSTPDSSWGAEDGLRVFVLAASTSGARVLLVSGRELPPPDLVDNYPFKPGKTLTLMPHPPRNASSWNTGPIELTEGDITFIAIVGINEGLPYVAGGGGGTGSAVMAAVAESFFSAAAGAIGGPIAGAAVAGVFAGLNEALAGLGTDDECRGGAFAFNLAMSAKYLFSRTAIPRTSTMRLRHETSDWGLAVKHGPRASGCGRPDYEVTFAMSLLDQPTVTERWSESNVRQGEITSYRGAMARCARDKEMIVWSMISDQTLVLESNFSWPTHIWRIDQTEIYTDSGSLTVPARVELPPQDELDRNVRLGYHVSDVGGRHRLTVTSEGNDGNFAIKVALLLKFADSVPPLMFWQRELVVEGQILHGNLAYYEYLECVMRFVRELRDVAERYVIPVRRPPWERWESVPELSGWVETAHQPSLPRRFAQFERDMVQMLRLIDDPEQPNLAGHSEPNGPLI